MNLFFIKKRLLAGFVSILCCITLASANEAITVHGTSTPRDEDEQNSTATVETLPLDHRHPTLGSALEDATGVGVQRNGNLGRGEFIQLRGTLSHQAQIQLEGIPLLLLQNQALNLSSLPMSLFDDVRIVRGGSVDYGSGAQGGVIQLTHRADANRPNELSLRLGSFGYRRLELIGSKTSNNDHIRIGIRVEQSKGNFEFEDRNQRIRTRENNDHQSLNLFSVGQGKIDRLGKLNVLLDTFIDTRGEPGPMEFPSLEARSDANRLLSGLQLKLTPKLRGRLQTTLMSFAQFRRSRFTDPAPGFAGGTTHFTMDDQILSAAVRNQYQLSTTLLLGLSCEGQRSIVNTRATKKAQHKRHLSSITVSSDWKATQDLTTTAGTRIQTGFGPLSVVPRFGISQKLSKHLKLNANVSQFFRIPSLDELYFEGVGISGNPDLSPEEGYGADLGFNWQHRKGSIRKISLHGFVTRFDNLIFFAPIDAYRFQSANHPGGVVLGTEVTVKGATRKSFSHMLPIAFNTLSPTESRTVTCRIDRRISHGSS